MVASRSSSRAARRWALTWRAGSPMRALPILEGYGLTETSPVIAVNQPQANKLGTIGLRMPNTDCRFAEDGELEVRGPGIFIGYWQKPEQTAAVMDGEWFKRATSAASTQTAS